MGLTIGVGWLARSAKEDVDEFAALSIPYQLLNEVLADAGMPPHDEPLDIADDAIFEAQMWGYGGLHAIRRLAAYHACEDRLPPPGRYEDYASDPMIETLNQEHLRNFRVEQGGLFKKFFSTSKNIPKFQHLLWHSDCEGFYLPRDFERVILDNSNPQREGIGGMVGSTSRLLQECLELAEVIDLPVDMDPEAEELWERADDPASDGEKWKIYGVEAFGLSRLIRACKLSIENNAAIVFG